MIRKQILLTADHVKRIDAERQRTGAATTEIIRRAIDLYLPSDTGAVRLVRPADHAGAVVPEKQLPLV